MLRDDNNPAARVYSVLRKVKDTGAKHVIDGFANVFGVSPDEHGEIFRKLGLLSLELDELSLRLQEIGNQHYLDIYLKTLPRLKKIFAFQNFLIPWDQYRSGYLFEDDLKTLEFCSAILSTHSPEQVLGEDELKSLLEEVNALWNEVLSSGLEKELKTKILDCLDQIRQAIRDYQILGTAGVERALSTGIVLVVITQHAKSNDSETLKKFWDFIKKASALIKFAKLLAPYASRFLKLLELKRH
jgi:hypothetical protein